MRAVLVLRYFEDLSVEQTARELGCSPGAVKSHTHHAIQRLRAALPEHDLIEELR
jgi:RNA polymerase sigma factor (sigma-70 family)